jgi:hypothetical protein
MKRIWKHGRALTLALVLPVVVAAAEVAVKPVAWSPHSDGFGCHMNMGPTGVRVWMRGYRFQVMAVDAGSPADGVLQSGDWIMGVAGTRFSGDVDSRMTLGNAIGRAEETDGRLALAIRRDGKDRHVVLQLAVTGPYAATWPYGCAKSQRVLHEACAYLLKAQFPDGAVVTDGGMGTFLSGLLLLASGEARFLDGARRAVYATTAMDFKKMETHNWPMGYGGLLLAEYYLATGDDSVLEKLEKIVDHFEQGQMRCGSWGHIGPSAGYGAMNQAGIICTITMVLAQECGIEVDREVLQRALSFYGQYAELGAVPYGDHGPGVRIPDDNGKSASTAVLCSLRPEWEGAASVFVQSVAMSYWLRETGHTGGLFSMIWGPLACAMAGEDQFRTFMDYQSWHYNLCRTWRGALVMLPYYEALTRFDDSTYAFFGGEFTTGGMALVYALPHRRLRILGAPRSVFAAELDGPLLKARQCYQSRRWEAFDAAVAVARDAAATPKKRRWLAQLESAAAMLQATTRRTVKEIENNLAEGDGYRASEQYSALKRLLGEEHEAVRALGPRFEDGTVKWHVRAGGQYYEAWHSLRAFTFQSWLPYGLPAKRLVGEVPELRVRPWEPLLDVAGTTSNLWEISGDTGSVSGRREFELMSTDYAALRLQLQSPRNSHTRVRLNGVQVAEAVRGQRSGHAEIDLDESAIALLKKGKNTIEINSTSAGSGGNALDIGLDGVVPERPLPSSPERVEGRLAVLQPVGPLRAALERARNTFHAMPVDDAPNPAVPERLRVRDSMDRFRAALDKACDAMSMDEVGEALRCPVAYWRYLAGGSLSRRGADGLKMAVAGFGDDDWRVRSACCDALTFVQPAGAQGDDAVPPIETGGAVVSRLTALLFDENAWVRCRAAGALGAIGRADTPAAAALARAAIDPDPWVRSAALGAIEKVTDDPRVLVNAARDALQVPSSSFSVTGKSLALIEKHGADDKKLIPALVFAVEHPGEGMWAHGLNKAMALLADLDSGGAKAVSAIAKVAAGGYAYDRLRGNPRKTAIDLLGKMGANAASAVPVLEGIVAGSNEKEEALREAAEAAIGEIGGTTRE